MNIMQIGGSVLTKKSELIQQGDTEVLKTLFQMARFIRNPENHACGLALPQIGINKRGFVAVFQDKVQICINPKIIKHSSKLYFVKGGESCLSVPIQDVRVPRNETIMVSYFDENFKLKTTTLKKFDGAVFAHEHNHLDGILITDYLPKEDAI